jgi:tetracycline resistance efflux pump
MLALVPAFIVVVLSVWLRRAFEPLLIGCLVGYLLINPSAFPNNFLEGLTLTLQEKDTVWVILVCGLYGSLIHLIIESGGVFAFGELALKYVNTRRKSLIITWLMGVFIFIDDYMSALAVGVTMRKITDRYRVSRALLAYLVNATAAPICVLIPMTTWSIFCGKLLEDNKIVGKGGAFQGFLNTIPYMFYAWVTVIVAFLVAMNVLPLFSRMKQAEIRAADDIQPKQKVETKSANPLAKPIHFFLPLIVLIIATIYLEKDALKGIFAGLTFTFCYYLGTRLMTFEQLSDGVFEGFKSMIYALAILIMGYVLKKVGDQMNLTPYVITSVQPYLSKTVLAAVLFVSLSGIGYMTAASWGLYLVAIPMVVPLAQSLDANVYLSLGAVFSAGVVGSQSSFYSDASVLTASSTECEGMEIFLTSLPYNVLSIIISTILFLIAGFLTV